MEQTLQLPRHFIGKLGLVLGALLVFCSVSVWVHASKVMQAGPSMAILFANEYGLTGISIVASSVRFVLNTVDALRPEQPFVHRTTVLYYLDFAVDLCKLIAYATFFFVVMYYYGLPLNIIRDLYLTVRSFVKRVHEMIRYQRIMASINTRYPTVHQHELDGLFDRTCIVCREEMGVGAKKLHCGHIFHFKCLKSWLERQQVCPTCRKSVLEEPPPHRSQYTGDQYPGAFYQRQHQGEGNRSNSNLSHGNGSSSSIGSHSHHSSSSNNIHNEKYPESSPFLLATPNFAPPTGNHALCTAAGPIMVIPPEPTANGHAMESLEADLVRAQRQSRFSEANSTGDLTRLRGKSLEHVNAQLEFVEELMEEHQIILQKLRRMQQIMSQDIEADRDDNVEDEPVVKQ